MKPRRRRRTSVSTMMAEMMLASWETMTRRAMLMAQNQCSPAEYRRMFGGKSRGGGFVSIETHVQRRPSEDDLRPGPVAPTRGRKRKALTQKVAERVRMPPSLGSPQMSVPLASRGN